MEEIDVRKYIINNFKEDNKEDIEKSILESINNGEEDTLFGLGVLFEICFKNAPAELKDKMLDIIYENIKKSLV